MPVYYDKHPDSVEDFGWDYSDRLGVGETIVTATFDVTGGATVADSDIIGGTVVVIRVEGGNFGEVNKITCDATTSTGQILPDSMVFRARNK